MLLSTDSLSRVNATFLFTDIVQSTAVRAACIREYGDKGNQVYDDLILRPHDAILDRLIAKFNGTVVSTAGDSYFTVFSYARDAVECAVRIQQELSAQPIVPPVQAGSLPDKIQIRIGLHTGGATPLPRAERLNFSDHNINIAARIEGLAQGGQILLSQETWKAVGQIDGLGVREWPARALKGVDGEWILVEILWDGYDSSNTSNNFVLNKDDVKQHLEISKPDYYSCFISFSYDNIEFTSKLYEHMKSANLHVWYSPEEMKAGEKVHEQIDRAIRLYDRLLLVISEESMRSPWVETEIYKAREREKQEGRRVLFPIRLVSFTQIREWQCFDADTGRDMAREIREYFIPDFSDWRDNEEFERNFKRLLRDLRTEERAE